MLALRKEQGGGRFTKEEAFREWAELENGWGRVSRGWGRVNGGRVSRGWGRVSGGRAARGVSRRAGCGGRSLQMGLETKVGALHGEHQMPGVLGLTLCRQWRASMFFVFCF